MDGLRGLAIALVLAIHSEGLVGALEPGDVSLGRAFVLGGHTGVSLFFVLSAFLLSRPFLAELRTGRRVERRRYFAGRALRILPLYALAVALASAACAERPADLLHGVPYLFFLQSIPTWVTPLLPYSGAWWSLATEVQFYLVLPLLPLLLRSRWRGPIALGAVAATAALALGALSFPTPTDQFIAAHSVLGRAPLFAWGIAAAWFYDRHGAELRAFTQRSGIAGRFTAELVLLAAFAALGVLLQWVVSVPYLEREAVEWPAWHVVEGALWALVVIVVLLVPTAIGRVFESGAARFLGNVSYPLFFVHTAVMIFGAEWIRSLRPGALIGWSAESVALLAALLAAAVAVAALAHVAIERPALRWKARVTGAAAPEPRPLPRAA
jgi:peptidoglycan/LPS O-acetylase OafA/YrhL